MAIAPDRTTLTESRWLTVYRDRLSYDDGSVYEYDHIVLPESVTVLAMDEDGRVAVTRQTIYTHRSRQWRLPAGGVEPGEDAATAARRELREETGLTGVKWTPLGVIHGADSVTNHRDSAFLVTELTAGSACRGVGEDDLEVHWRPLTVLLDLVLTGEMPHAGSACAVLTAALILRS